MRQDIREQLAELQRSRREQEGLLQHREDQQEIWEDVGEKIDNGKVLCPPNERSKKRRASVQNGPNKKSKWWLKEDSGHIDCANSKATGDEKSAREDEQDPGPGLAVPLTTEDVRMKLGELKERRKAARRQRMRAEEHVQRLQEQMASAECDEEAIEADIARGCIQGRNEYSKGAIKCDFAAGIRELDQVVAAEDDEEIFNLEVDARNYAQIERSLRVFCVSARGYQQLPGRFL